MDDSGVPYDKQTIYGLCKPFIKTLFTKSLEKVKFLSEFNDGVIEMTLDHCEICEVHCLLPKHRRIDKKCGLQSAKSFQNL